MDPSEDTRCGLSLFRAVLKAGRRKVIKSGKVAVVDGRWYQAGIGKLSGGRWRNRVITCDGDGFSSVKGSGYVLA